MGRHTCLPVLAKHQVHAVQGSGTPHVSPLLAIVGHVEGDPTLRVEMPRDPGLVMVGSNGEPCELCLTSEDPQSTLFLKAGPRLGHIGLLPIEELPGQ
jgi:hypothetical protein